MIGIKNDKLQTRNHKNDRKIFTENIIVNSFLIYILSLFKEICFYFKFSKCFNKK